MNDNPVVRAESLCKTFGKKTVLNNVSLEIRRGEIFGYLGPNGSGKTTTMRILLGLLRPTRGNIFVLNQTPEEMSPETRSKIGAVLDDHGLFENLTVHQNLEYYCQIFRMPARACGLRVQECLEYVDMDRLSKEKIKTFSKGMKQRVALARCLLNHPEIIFLDEPTAGLDPEATVKIRELMQGLARNERTTIFLNSHDLDEVERIAGSIAILNQGEIVAQGALPELKKHLNKSVVAIQLLEQANLIGIEESLLRLPFVRNVKILENHVLHVEIIENKYQSDLVSSCVALGLPVYSVNQISSRLEDVYLSIVEEVENNGA